MEVGEARSWINLTVLSKDGCFFCVNCQINSDKKGLVPHRGAISNHTGDKAENITWTSIINLDV